MELINQLADKDLVQSLSVGDKVLGGLMVAAVGMTITFLALVFLWTAIGVMSKVLGGEKKQKVVETPAPKQQQPQTLASQSNSAQEDEELVAVITAAIAASLKTSIHNIVVSNITRVPDDSPAWAKTGRTQQIDSRF